MYQCRRLVVGLQLNEQDANLIRYAEMVSRIVEPELLVFVHVVQKPDIPDDIRRKFPQLAETSLSRAKQQLAERVEQHWKQQLPGKTRYQVAEGCPLRELLHLSRQHEADLVMLGRASPPTHLGQLSERLTRKAPCSALIVPENCPARIRGIMVPVDFSSHSDDALEIAVALANFSKLASIDCLHAFRVPPDYEKTGVPYEEFAEEMRKSALRRFAAIAEKYASAAVELRPDVALDRNPAHAIEQAVQSHADDLIIVGARGRNVAAAVLLGGVAEHLIWTTKVPLLVVRRKGANAALLDALLAN
jgi:nucleotide-binding universal stress UspA family protein